MKTKYRFIALLLCVILLSNTLVFAETDSLRSVFSCPDCGQSGTHHENCPNYFEICDYCGEEGHYGTCMPQVGLSVDETLYMETVSDLTQTVGETTVGVSGSLYAEMYFYAEDATDSHTMSLLEDALSDSHDLSAQLIAEAGVEEAVAFSYNISLEETGMADTLTINGLDNAENGQYLSLYVLDQDGNAVETGESAYVYDGSVTFSVDNLADDSGKTYAGVYTWYGMGTPEDPFRINTVRDLEYMAYCTSKGLDLHNCWFEQTSDIDLADVVWIPIGGYAVQDDDEPAPFRGVYNGGRMAITHMTILDATRSELGLFGLVGDDATIQNVLVSGTVEGLNNAAGVVGSIEGSNVVVAGCESSCTVTAQSHVGGIVGSLYGNAVITGCKNTGNISQSASDPALTHGYAGGIVGYYEIPEGEIVSEITACTNEGEITGTDSSVGGIAGYANGPVSYCENKASVTGTSDMVGGIVGFTFENDILECRNDGEIEGSKYVGGIVGHGEHEYLSIQWCTNNGSVTAKTHVGGIAGHLDGNMTHKTNMMTGVTTITFCSDISVYYCHNSGDVTGENRISTTSATYAGGIVGWCEYGHVDRCSNEGDVWAEYHNAGGISGDLGLLTNCWNSGNVRASVYAGGIVSSVEPGATNSVANCYNKGTVTLGVCDCRRCYGNTAMFGGSIAGSAGAAGAKNAPYHYYSYVGNVYSTGGLVIENAGENPELLGVSGAIGHADSSDAVLENVYLRDDLKIVNPAYPELYPDYNDPEYCGPILYMYPEFYESLGTNINFGGNYVPNSNKFIAFIGRDYSFGINDGIIVGNAPVKNDRTFQTVDELIYDLNSLDPSVIQGIASSYFYEVTLEPFQADGTFGFIAGVGGCIAPDVRHEAVFTLTYSGDYNGVSVLDAQALPVGGSTEVVYTVSDLEEEHCVNVVQYEGQNEQFTFRGWNTKPDGSGQMYVPGTNIRSADGRPVTLYAQWDMGWIIRYTYAEGVDPDLRYEDNMMPVDRNYYPTGEFATLHDFTVSDLFTNDFTMGDFGYWQYTNSDGRVMRVYPGEELEMTENVTLEAIVVFDLTITAQADAATVGEVFLFTITRDESNSIDEFEPITVTIPAYDSIVIEDLPAGVYTVTQNMDWAWRYDRLSVTSFVRDCDADCGNEACPYCGTSSGLPDPESCTCEYESFEVDNNWSSGLHSHEVSHIHYCINPICQLETDEASAICPVCASRDTLKYAEYSITFGSPNNATAYVYFKNILTNKQWISSTAYCENLFVGDTVIRRDEDDIPVSQETTE